jgi:hypothetical protein
MSILILNFYKGRLFFSFTSLLCQTAGAGVAIGYWLDDRGVGVRVPIGSNILSLHAVQTGSEAHPASNPMSTGGSFPGGKAMGT